MLGYKDKLFLVFTYYLFYFTNLSVKCLVYNNLTQGNCPEGSIECPIDPLNNRSKVDYCILQEQLCDGKFDCPGGFEEFHCESADHVGFHFLHKQLDCSDEELNCIERGEERSCFSINQLCDGFVDCSDGSDEKFCPYFSEGFRFKFDFDSCPDDMYRCHSGEPLFILERTIFDENELCINKSTICDGVIDCMDESDEMFCPYVFKDSPQVMPLIPGKSSSLQNELTTSSPTWPTNNASGETFTSTPSKVVLNPTVPSFLHFEIENITTANRFKGESTSNTTEVITPDADNQISTIGYQSTAPPPADCCKYGKNFFNDWTVGLVICVVLAINSSWILFLTIGFVVVYRRKVSCNCRNSFHQKLLNNQTQWKDY